MTILNIYEELEEALGYPVIDLKDTVAESDDVANKELQGMVVETSYQIPMVQRMVQAKLITDRLIQTTAYPLLEVVLICNRSASKLQRGDLFKFSYTPYSIVDMVCRVVDIEEENLFSENLVITAKEDIDYISSQSLINSETIGSAGNTGVPANQWVDPLINVKVIETPFILAGDNIGIFTIASRVLGNEIGYKVYMSVDDGLSYSSLDNVSSFAPYGSLVGEYPMNTHTIDDLVGFEIDSSNVDINEIQTIQRALLFTEDNFALLGNELISIQTITPDEFVDDRYSITGIYRGRMDTEPITHSADTDFYFISNTNGRHIESPKIVAGAELKFKYVPYSKNIGQISDAIVMALSIEGRAKKPYRPKDLKANDILINPEYSSAIILTWSPRLRGDGAGVGIANSITDAEPIWEGLFEVQVYVSDVLIRTVQDIDSITWEYTSAMNIIDNGSLADEVIFEVINYRVVDNYTYKSGSITNTVSKIS